MSASSVFLWGLAALALLLAQRLLMRRMRRRQTELEHLLAATSAQLDAARAAGPMHAPPPAPKPAPLVAMPLPQPLPPPAPPAAPSSTLPAPGRPPGTDRPRATRRGRAGHPASGDGTALPHTGLVLTPSTPAAAPEGTVLIVHPDAAVREHLMRCLAPHHHVVMAGDAAAALDCLRDTPPDVVATSLQMPHLDGAALVRAARAEGRAPLPVLLLADGDDADALEADDYLPRPYEPREARARIRNLLKLRHADRPIAASAAIDLCELAHQLAGELAPRYRHRRLSLHLEAPSTPVPVRADAALPDLLRRVLDAALAQADEGVTLQISVSQEEEGGRLALHLAALPGGLSFDLAGIATGRLHLAQAQDGNLLLALDLPAA